jgi:hypothetical protein
MKRWLYWLTLSVCCLLNTTANAKDPVTGNIYLQQLIQQAREQQLADSAQWHRLLHYRQGLLGSIESEADDPAFFTAPDGKHNPQQEIEATLRAFFSDKPWGQKDEPAQCAFIARYEWLNQQLRFDPRLLPKQDCPAFDKWYRGINPGSITLIFPSSYLNNPSSMFGHTLLRVDAAQQNESTRLLAYAINYGAETGTDNGVAFAVKGIFGGYHGTVGIGPYYKKVKEYSDTESRDIWEYQLDMTPEEIRRLLTHVWELRGVYFEYFFFDENCSYFILALLDVARPELDLSTRLYGWVIPSDTLRLVSQQTGLVQQVVYRPSAGTKLSHLVSQLPQANLSEALALANGERAVTDTVNGTHGSQAKADILLLAHDYLRYEFLAQRRERGPSAKLSQQLLQARSAITEARANSPVPTPQVSPERGHATGMIQLGAGRLDDDDFVQLDLRPAYHDLLDNDDGYINGAKIDFLRTSLRHYPAQDKTRLNEFTLVDITSLSPRNQFFRPVSWRIRASWQRRIVEANDQAMSFRLDGGAGITLRPAQQVTLFGLVNLGIDRHRQFKDDYSAGYGLELGAILQPMPRWKIMLRTQEMQYQKHADHHYTTLQVGQRISLAKQHALDLQWEQQQALGRRVETAILAWRWYL